MMRPVMSAERSAFTCGETWPLAVTEATRSRFCTPSMRTSVGCLFFLTAVTAITPASARTATLKIPNFIPLLMTIPG